MAKNLWQRWKRLAHRAAEIQAVVLLSIVYWLIVVPVGGVQKLGRRKPVEAGWKTRPPGGPVPIEEARRQS